MPGMIEESSESEDEGRNQKHEQNEGGLSELMDGGGGLDLGGG